MDYRRLYIEHPRVRYDGVYIAVCHYMYVPWYQHYVSADKKHRIMYRRNGVGENVWVNVRADPCDRSWRSCANQPVGYSTVTLSHITDICKCITVR